MLQARVAVDGREHDVTLARRGGTWDVTVDGTAFPVTLDPNGTGLLLRVGGATYHVERRGDAFRLDGQPVALRVLQASQAPAGGATRGTRTLHLRPPMNGRIERIAVAVGQQVAKGEVL
jgi:acetyl/propionyl-CoA carboxylase alpha subunit